MLHLDENVDVIIDIVRSALLDDKVAEKFTRHLYEATVPNGGNNISPTWEEMKSNTARYPVYQFNDVMNVGYRHISGLLDAAFGKEARDAD